MKRTIENCSLIRSCTEIVKLEKPRVTEEGLCEGYIKRGKLVVTCSKCSLCSRSTHKRKGR